MSTTDTMTDAERYARTIADEVRGLEDGVLEGYEDELAELDPFDRIYQAATYWLDELALDVEVTRSAASGDVTAVTITRTLGGPWCAVTFDHYGEHTVRAAWGGDRAEVILAGREVATVADYVLDTFAEVTA